MCVCVCVCACVCVCVCVCVFVCVCVCATFKKLYMLQNGSIRIFENLSGFFQRRSLGDFHENKMSMGLDNRKNLVIQL